jgi:hypothetical protein
MYSVLSTIQSYVGSRKHLVCWYVRYITYMMMYDILDTVFYLSRAGLLHLRRKHTSSWVVIVMMRPRIMF